MSDHGHECPYCGGEDISRRRKYRFWLNKVGGWCVVAVHLGFLLFFFSFVRGFAGSPVGLDLSDRDFDVSSVEIANEDMVMLDDRYNESVEKGFCLFGSVRNGSVVVREIDYVESPLDSGEGFVSFSCKDEISSRLDKMALNGSYKFLGRVHTHPDSSDRLSFADMHSFGRWSGFSVVHGVFDGEQLNFWSHDDLHGELGLDVVVRSG